METLATIWSKGRAPKLPLLMLFGYFSQFFICGLNWWWFVSYEEALFGTQLVNSHLGFNIVGTISFLVIGSPFLFWPYHYGPQMPPRTRRNCVFLCLAIVYFSHDFPLWLMEFYMVWQYGWINKLQGISLFLLTFTTAFGTFGVWLGYAWKMSKLCHKYFGSPSMSGAPGGIHRVSGGGMTELQRI